MDTLLIHFIISHSFSILDLDGFKCTIVCYTLFSLCIKFEALYQFIFDICSIIPLEGDERVPSSLFLAVCF